MSWDIRFVVGLDFGTTFSGFSYCHKDDKTIKTNIEWPGEKDGFKTNTVLQYDENLNVQSWGYPALAKRPNRNFDINEQKYVAELFKLHLGGLNDSLKPNLPNGLEYKKTIVDYLREIGKWIKMTIKKDWHHHFDETKFFEQVLLVLTVPAEYSEKAKAIMRDCVHQAELIDERNSDKLQFTTEPEAAAIHCRDSLGEHDLTCGTIFMIVDCGGGTVDLTTRKLLDGNRLGEVTERIGDFCGSSFVDGEFIKYLRRELGNEAINLLRDNFYGQMQFLVQSFCQNAKLPFTGDDQNFCYEINLEEVSPVLLQYVSGERRQRMEAAEWLIELDYNTIKSMFDPVVERILRMMHTQIENTSGVKDPSDTSGVDKTPEKRKTDIIYLVGGFSQSAYLQKRIKEEFSGHNISVPNIPIAAISRGAAIYGKSFSEIDNLDMDGQFSIIDSRILRYTYGIKVYKSGEGFLFKSLAKRGDEVRINEAFSVRVQPSHPFQSTGLFEIYYTRNFSARTCKELGMKLFGILKIDWSDDKHVMDRPTTFKLEFGKMELKATAQNENNGQTYHTSFDLQDDE